MSGSLSIVDLSTKRIKLTEEQKKENAKRAMKNYYNNNKEKCHMYQKKSYDNMPEDKKHARLEKEREKTKNRVKNMNNEQYKQYIAYIAEYNKNHLEQRKTISAKYWLNKQAKKKGTPIIENETQIIENDLTIDFFD